MRTAKSISMESELWLEVEKVRREKNFSTVSEAVEYLIKKALKKI